MVLLTVSHVLIIVMQSRIILLNYNLEVRNEFANTQRRKSGINSIMPLCLYNPVKLVTMKSLKKLHQKIENEEKELVKELNAITCNAIEAPNGLIARSQTSLTYSWRRAKSQIMAFVKLKGLSEDIKMFGANVKIKNYEITEDTKLDELLLSLQKSRIFVETKLPKKKWYLIYPESNIKNIWSFVSIFLLLYTSFITPYRICFLDEVPPQFKALEWVIDTLILIEIITNILSVHVTDDGEIVADLKLQFKMYLKTWFFVDLLSIFPFQLFSFGAGGDQYGDLIKILRLPRLYRLIRIARMVKALKKVKKNKYIQWLQDVVHLHQGALRMLNLILLVIIIVHLFGCLWFLAAKFFDFRPSSWVYR